MTLSRGIGRGGHNKSKLVKGQRWGRLTYIKDADDYISPSGNRRRQVECQCDCGNLHILHLINLSGKGTKSCGCLKTELHKLKIGPMSTRWKGGRSLDSHGYVVIRTDINTQRLEHHVVMEQIIGRKLCPSETVHHLNGIRSDNRSKNLELWASRHPKGQRVEDLLAFADEIIACYRLKENAYD